MPAKPRLQIDREVVKALFVQGFMPAQVAAKVGMNPRTVATWARRGNWRSLRAENAKLTRIVTGPTLAPSVARSSESVRTGLASELELQISKLRDVPAKSGLEHVARRAQVAKTIVDSAARTFGWDEQRSSSAVSVETMMDLAHGARPALPEATVTVAPAVESSDSVSEAQKAQAIDTQATEPTIESFMPDL